MIDSWDDLVYLWWGYYLLTGIIGATDKNITDPHLLTEEAVFWYSPIESREDIIEGNKNHEDWSYCLRFIKFRDKPE
jgi:hypothetical protein